MRTRINRIALSLTLIAATTLTATSCLPDSTAPLADGSTAANPGKVTPPFAAKYAWMGEYHNNALTYAFARINRSKAATRFEKCVVGLAALQEFQRAFRKSGGSAVFDDLSITDGMCEAAERRGPAISNSFSVSSDGDVISAAASGYMDKISAAVDAMTSVSGLNYTVNKITSSAASTLVALEAGAVAGSGSIAVSSADYWTTSEGTSGDGGPQLAYSLNAPRTPTTDLGITPPSEPRYAIGARTKRIIKADVSAAIGVLVYEWWTGEVAVAKAAIKAAAASLIAGIYTY
jgi:hypothetical protein